MAKSIHSKYRSRARRPSPEKAPSQLQTHTRTAADLAERDLLAAILDAAAEDRGVERYLPQIVAHLGKYARCNCIGIILFAEDGIVGCTSCHGSAAEFTRIPTGSFPGSDKCICSSMLKGQSNIRPADSTEGRAFFRNSKSAPSTRTEVADEAFGICIGSSFESVALMPIGNPKTVAGFIFMGDERKDRIPQRKLKVLERVGAYVGSMVQAVEAGDNLDLLNHNLPGPQGNAGTAPHDADEMELLTRLIENSNESIVISQDWRIIYVNNKCAEMAGLTRDDMIGLAFLDITHPDDREAVKERYSRILNGEWFPTGTVLRGLDKDGNTRWAELREIPFSWHGRPAVMSLVNDITDRRRAEEALAESEKKYKALADNSLQGIVIAQGTPPRIAYCNAAMAGLTGYTSGELLSMTPQQIVNLIHPDDRDMFFERYAARIKGLPVEPRYEFRAVRQDGAVIWLEIFATAIEYLGEPAIQAAFVDITDRKRAEEMVRESEEKYRLLTEKANDIIWTTDLNLHATYVSPSVERISGFTVEERMNQDVTQMMTPESLARATEALAEHLALEQDPKADPNRTLIIELDYYRKDGSTIWLENQVSSLRDASGTLIGFHGVARDVTEPRRARETLQVSEERYRLLADNAADVIFTADLQGKPTYVSPSVSYVLGYTVEEALQRPLRLTLGSESLEAATRVITEQLLEERAKGPNLSRSWALETEMLRKDGSHIWTDVSISFMRRPDGRPIGIMGRVRDISDRKKADVALKASEERFRALIEKSTDAIAILDREGKLVYESRSMERITGYKLEDWLGKPMGDWLLHPDDLVTIASSLERLLSHPELTSEEIRVRFRHKDGSWHFLEGTVRNLLRDPSVNGIVVNYRDVTERKRAEEALQASELRYRLLAENASDVIFTSDLAMKLTYVSPSIVQLTGYSPEETMSRDIHDWVAPASREFVSKSFAWAVAKAKSGTDLPQAMRTTNLEMLRKEGGTVWAEIRIDFLRDADGQPVGILGVARDITDRRIAEMELEHRVQLETLITEISTAFIGISTDYIDQGIQNALGSISEFTGVDRSYIFMFSEDRSMIYLAHEWSKQETGALNGVPYSLPVDSIPWLAEKIRQAECANIPDLAETPIEAEAERALFTRQGVQSIMVVPMVQSGNAIGFLALGSTHGKKTWDEETIVVLRLVAEMFSNATERKRMDLALRESEKRYRLLAENITDVIWTTDMQTNITYMSPSATRLVGYSTEELGKLTVKDLLTPDSFERGMKALSEQQTEVSQRQNGQPDHWTLEVEMRCKDGSTVWAEEKVTFLRDEDGTPIGLLGTTRDISRRKAMQDALRLSEDKYRTLVEASPDGVLSIDSRGVITDCNPGLCKMLGYEKEQLCGREARLLRTKKDLDAEAYYSAHLARGEFMEVETEILRHNGQTLPVWAKLVRLVEPNTADIQTIIYFRDIADRRKIDEMKDEFVGLVSHELRSPLTVIIGALHTAISEGPRLSQKETRQLLEDAALEAEQLSHLVGNLLELSRAQANRLFLHVEPINMAKAAHKVIGSIERQSSKHKFIVDLPRKLPPVSADQLRLERILYNLLENSVKYSPEGSEITVSAKREAGHLVVSVTDQGPGISKEDQAKLFKPFQQLGDPMLDHTKGAGLGLLVCRRLVEAHGGHIWVESEPGHGATFNFTLEDSPKNDPDAG